jgi:5'-nucleotidase/UDP-sugar diphosphatase
MQLARRLLLLGLIFALTGCALSPQTAPEKDKTYKLTVMHTNDHHGRFWHNSDGEYGMAARKTVVATACCSMAAMLTPACPSPTCKTRCLTSRA